MNKLIKRTLWALSGLVLLIYIVLATVLWWGDHVALRPDKELPGLLARSYLPHDVRMIDDGLASLDLRLRMINGAKKSIEVESFIYELDLASQLVTQHLIEAARRGVSVRILVDFSYPVFKLKPSYAYLLKKNGIQVKYYNTAGMLRFVSSQHRSHRKLLLIDGQEALTGGRNIGNEYFNLNPKYNFIDSDIYVKGPIVNDILKSFTTYWSTNFAVSPDANPPEHVSDVAEKLINPTRDAIAAKNELEQLHTELEKSYLKGTCNDLTFVSDFPGILSSNRQVYKELAEFLGGAKSSIIGESAYFVLGKEGKNLVKSLAQKGIEQIYTTNTLYSTDAFYTVAAMAPTLPSLTVPNFSLFLYSGDVPSQHHSLKQGSSDRWGIHSKRGVVDHKDVLIGTYNVDPRSANLNSELLLICRNNPELAKSVESSMQRRRSQAFPVVENQELHIGALFKGSTLGQRLLFFVTLPLSRLFDFLL